MAADEPTSNTRSIWKKILVMGNTGSGKSTTINALVNNSVHKTDLMKPAPTGSPLQASSVTSSLSLYFSSKTMYIDSIGFGDSNKTGDEVLKDLQKYLFLGQTNIHGIFFVVPARKLSAHDRDCFNLIRSLFSEEAIEQFVHVILTYADDGSTWNEYEEANSEHDKELLDLFNRCKSRTVGTWHSHLNSQRDISGCQPDRQNFLTALHSVVNQIDLQFFTSIQPTSVWQRLALFFRKIFSSNLPGYEKLLTELLRKNNPVFGGTCSICLEDIFNDIYVLKCSHIYHYDCIVSWGATPLGDTCPLCRKPIEEFVAQHRISTDFALAKQLSSPSLKPPKPDNPDDDDDDEN